MNLELASIPLAWVSGALSILSPCVWPIVPVVMGAAATSGRSGPLFLALGLSSSFAVAGTFLTFLLLNVGLDPEWPRYIAASLLSFAGLVLLIRPLNEWVSHYLSLLTARFIPQKTENQVQGPAKETIRASGQFLIGTTLGLVWLPCVGPTVGAAIALASLGQNMLMAFAVMFAFGLGMASILLLAGLVSRKMLNYWRPEVLASARFVKQILGTALLLVGLMVLFGFDRALEGWLIGFVPTQ